MGLDQNIYKFKKHEDASNFYNEDYEWMQKREVAYWRKRFGVQDYFSNIFYYKNPSVRYEGQPFELSKKDIKAFAKEVENKHSIIYENDSFGWDDSWKTLRDMCRKDIKKCKKALKKGYKLYYIASW